MVGLEHYLTVAAALFVIGIFGIFLNRKNVIILLMSIELILLAVNINLVAFSSFLGDLVGQIFTLFVLTVAAAEAAIGLAILVCFFSHHFIEFFFREMVSDRKFLKQFRSTWALLNNCKIKPTNIPNDMSFANPVRVNANIVAARFKLYADQLVAPEIIHARRRLHRGNDLRRCNYECRGI